MPWGLGLCPSAREKPRFSRRILTVPAAAAHEGVFKGENFFEFAVAAVHIEAVADDEEFAGEVEADVIGFGIACLTFEEGGDFDAACVFVGDELAQLFE